MKFPENLASNATDRSYVATDGRTSSSPARLIRSIPQRREGLLAVEVKPISLEVYALSLSPDRSKLSFADSMIELVSSLAKALVDHPEEVSIEAVEDPTSTMLRLRVAPEDLGKVIGKQGRTARSIRTILAAASMKAQHRFALDIQQVGGAPGRNSPVLEEEE